VLQHTASFRIGHYIVDTCNTVFCGNVKSSARSKPVVSIKFLLIVYLYGF